MLTTQQLREQRASLFEKMKAVSDRASAENRLLSAEEVATYDRVDAEYTQVEDEIDRREAAQAREKNMVRRDPSGTLEDSGQVVGDGEAYNRVFTNFLRRGMADLSPEDKAVMSGKASQILNAAGIGTGAAGGFTVSPEFRDKLIETQKWYGPMLQEAEVIHTETGAQLPWPTNDDTANVGAILAENTQVTEQDGTFGTANIDAYMYTSKMVRVSYQLMQDSAFNLGVWLPRKLGTRLGRILNQHFTTGTGTNQPDGIVTSAAVGATSTGSYALRPGGWLALFHLTVLSALVGYAVWSWLLRHLPASTVAFFIFLNPPLTMLSKLLLAAALPALFAFRWIPLELLGSALALAGLAIAIWPRRSAAAA